MCKNCYTFFKASLRQSCYLAFTTTFSGGFLDPISEFDPVDETWKDIANLNVGERTQHSVSVVKTIDIINDISPEDCRLQLGKLRNRTQFENIIFLYYF